MFSFDEPFGSSDGEVPLWRRDQAQSIMDRFVTKVKQREYHLADTMDELFD
jgi:hypothetical protein